MKNTILVSPIIDTLKTNYKQYGLMLNEERMFPSIYDGLKLVNRRLLYTLYLLTKNGNLTKSARVVGTTMARFHPHSGDSLYESTVKLYHAGYLDKQGNFGIIGGLDGIKKNPPAAMRYTECKLNSKIKSMLFDLIKFVPHDTLELEPEPLYLPTMLPLSFFSAELNASIGFGIKSVFPTYTKKDLIRRLFYLIGVTKTEPIIKPTYPGEIQVLSPDKDCKKLLKTGEGSIIFKPRVIYEKSKIIILGRPFNKDFRTLLMNKIFKDQLQQEQVSLIDETVDERATKVVINIFSKKLKGTDFKNQLEKELTTKINFNCLFVNEDKSLKKYSVDEILLRTYNQFKDLFFKKVEADITTITNKIQDLTVIKKIRPHLGKYLKESSVSYDNVALKLSKDCGVKAEVIKKIFDRYLIKTLITCSTDIKPLLEQIKELKKKKTDAYIISLYKALV